MTVTALLWLLLRIVLVASGLFGLIALGLLLFNEQVGKPLGRWDDRGGEAMTSLLMLVGFTVGATCGYVLYVVVRMLWDSHQTTKAFRSWEDRHRSGQWRVK